MSLSESAGAHEHGATAASRGTGDRRRKRPRSEEQDAGAAKERGARRASSSVTGCFMSGHANPTACEEAPHWICHRRGCMVHTAAGGDAVAGTAGVEDDDHDGTEQISAPAHDTTSPTRGIATFSGERAVVESRRRLTLADLDAAAHDSCSASTSGGRAALVVMVRRGLELLLPGDALAAERTRMFDSISEESWERELKASWNQAVPAPGSGEGSDMSQHNRSESNPSQSQAAPSVGTQQTPVLQYDTAPDYSAVDFAMMTLNSSENGDILGQSCDKSPPMPPSAQSASTAVETTGVATVHTPQQELVAEIEALLGPSYWHCEHVAALIAAEADSSVPTSRLQEQRHLCHEVRVYAEIVSISDPPALLLLAAQKEAHRLSCLLESHALSGSPDNPAATEDDVFAKLADDRTRVATASSPKLVNSSATTEEPTAPSWNALEDEQAKFRRRAVNSVRRVMQNDPCWKAVRELLSVHGIGLRKAMIVHEQQHSSSTSDPETALHMETSASIAAHSGVSTGLLEKQLGLTRCQQLALNVRGRAVAPRVCPQPVVAEVLRRLQAQCEVITDRDIVFRCRTTRPAADRLGPDPRFAYVLVLVLSYSTIVKPGLQMQSAAQGEGNDPSVSNAKSNSIVRHHLRQQVEALLRQLEERQRCFPSAPVSASSEGLDVPTAAAAATCNLDQAQFIIQEIAWDDDDDVASCTAVQERLRQYGHLQEAKPERMCAHVTLGSWNPLLLDLRILPRKWSSLGRAWYSMGPAHLSRRILAAHGTGPGDVETAAQHASAGTGVAELCNNSAELLMLFCDRETVQHGSGSTETLCTRLANAPVGELQVQSHQ